MTDDHLDATSYMLKQLGTYMNKKTYVFYAGLLYGEYENLLHIPHRELPDGCFIYNPRDKTKKYWYLNDLTPVLDEDVPKQLKLSVLLMNV